MKKQDRTQSRHPGQAQEGEQKGLKIRSYLTVAIWGALAVSMVISALLFALLDRFLNLPRSIPTLGWLLIFNTLISGIITAFMNGKILAPVTLLSKAMAEVAQGDFEQQLETTSRIDEIRDLFGSFNVMTQELRATELLQTDFVSNVSHEFKTPINAIEGYTMLLQDDALSAEQNEYVEKILFNTGRLSGLVGNILLLSKLENQNIPMKRTTYRLDEQIRQALLSLESKWTPKEIAFQADLEKTDYCGNEGLLMHVWVNLIDNAVKFSPVRATVSLLLKSEEDTVVFSIKDEGPGIAQDVRSRIFDKFYQEDGSHKSDGNGLGLALVKRIVDSEKGTIEVNNREYGGCCFTVRLPK
ncbi:MAG: HAMP domain-containing sensor histidine kinase [Lachnospiraceae bacterium]|uniref:HAMP domain-containing sensor histidine kinase n=1 Tax=Parablautia sp. Marseille-Q6255 TaxID=3039593 RepID=UPI0024BBEC41|nr:HAMP domain-containing sensor histidine kinase [Parablautia sp. Marseille-Q6255]